MRRNLVFILTLFVCALGIDTALAASAAAPVNTAAAPYCPPGAKFCPAPGTNNTVFLDTHFGMDAKTGEVTAYKGNTHPDDVYNGPGTQEKVLYVSPPISVENRYVPYPGAPQTNMVASTEAIYQPQVYQAPTPAPARTYQPAVMPQPVAASQDDLATVVPDSQAQQSWNQKLFGWTRQLKPSRRGDAQSEVADKQAYRGTGKENVANDDIPWYKGGWWRNKKDDGGRPAPAPSNKTASSGKASGKSAGAPPAQDDMWDQDEYSSGGNQGGYANDPFAAPVFTNGNGGAYSAAPQQYNDPYAVGSHAPQSGGFVGDAYTMPNSPPPTSPYQEGYVYPGTTLSYDSTGQGGFPSQQGYPPVSNTTTYVATPNGGSNFLPPPPASAQTARSLPTGDPQGSPQFENAVRMVKENRFSEAKGILVSETSRDPSNSAAWRWLGDCHYNLLELDDAISSYQRALDRDPNDYYALRGQGFSYLHRGHEFWRRMQEEVAQGQKEQAAATFSQAHENYKKSLELLGLCLRRAPNDGEAIYGEAMAAEGASRKLYSNAISYLKLGPEQRERAELFAENCLTVINKGIERSRERAKEKPGDSGPRALLGGLYLRKAILYHQLGKNDLALIELRNSRDVQQSILDEIDKNNVTAQKGVKEAENYWNAWGGPGAGK